MLDGPGLVTMSQTYNPPALPTRRARPLLIAVWGLLTLVAVGFVLACACNMPAVDEWEFVGVLVGKEPVGPWLRAQHNEHRLPLSRLLYYGEFRLTRDFRASMLLQVAMVSLLCLGLMRLAASLRGRPDWPDLFFPISLLHFGHWENFLLGYQICFALFLVLVMGLVTVVLRSRPETAFRSGVVGGVLLLLTTLTGGAGLVLVPPVAVWLIYLAVMVARREGTAKAAIIAVIALASVIYLATYFVGYEKPANHPSPSTNPLRVLTISGEVLAMAIGVGVSGIWWAVVAAEVGLGVVTLVLLVQQGQTQADRPASFGLVAALAGITGLALAVGIGRAGFEGDMGLWSRYSFLMWPLLGIAYFVGVKAGREWIPISLCAAAALAFPTNTGSGIVRGAGIVAVDTAFEGDARQGAFDHEMINRHFPKSRNDGQEERARRAIPMLREAHIGPFAPDGQDTSRLWLVAVELVLAILVGRWLWNVGRAVQAERARELFRLQHERFEEQLLAAATATGLPRGLRWVSCTINGDALLVRDTTTSTIVALVPVVIQFEPVEGSDMESVPAAHEPRPATAVFTFVRGNWQTNGRVVFNHTPEETAARFAPRFRVIHHGHH